jgi:ACDE family multidrug resistance protein
VNLRERPKAVWAVAFACVIAFMGIALVDPIVPASAGFAPWGANEGA